MPLFWNNKKVFITGHTGFKGSWLSLWLSSLGAKVYGYSLEPNTEKSLFDTLKIEDMIELSTIGDIRDLDKLKNNICSVDPDIVFHMAAQPLVRHSYDFPIETIGTNVMGTANVLESFKICDSLKASVMVTSDKCYENKERLKSYSEDEPMGGYDPYSASKGCSELIISSYRNSFFSSESNIDNKNAIASARAGNVIGGGDWSMDRLLPDAIRSFNNNEELFIRSPNAVRPWQHVLEPLNGYMILAQSLYEGGSKFSSGWNFGPDDSDNISVIDIVKLIQKNWPNEISWQIGNSKEKHEAKLLKLNCSKAKSKLHWAPVWNANEAVVKTLDWNFALLSNLNMKDFSLTQINEYTKELKNNV